MSGDRSRPTPRGPLAGRGSVLAGFPVADTLAGVGLILVAALSLALLSGQLPLGAGGGGGRDGGGPIRTATP